MSLFDYVKQLQIHIPQLVIFAMGSTTMCFSLTVIITSSFGGFTFKMEYFYF
jgi:hypothetical protein